MSSSPDSPEVHHHGQRGSTITIDNLPDEILMDIFERVPQMSQRDTPHLESMRYSWMRPSDYPKDIPPEESMLAPLRLSQVCSLWRSLATSCPSLWTEITVLICKDDSAQRDEWFLNAVDTWLSRSGVSPLRLRIVGDISCSWLTWCDPDDAPGPKLEITAHILRKLLDHQDRWRDASCTFIGHDPRILPQLGLVDAPLLESLPFCWVGLAQLHDMTQINLDISCSPRLRSLHLEGIPRITTGGVSNLRELTLLSASDETSIKQSVFLQLLQAIPNLQILVFKAIHCESDAPQSSLITLARLHTLAVDDNGDSAFLISSQEFSAMLVRSRPALEYYELSHIRVGGDTVAPFLQLMPGLKTLCLVTDPYTPDLVEMLSVKETAESQDINAFLCPNLEKLIVKNCGYWNCNL
ncbi:uncharacterized protein FOMMEDRAFT_149650 [Fomitiporia mediterranea MF3/22]|uniref:Uncharacterized protein n=1 Tax=Fomitiporia mediterranea (strain MF3/22) TaxID=694068 RepID=R7SH01_FOMME|nr:uncharacterized protein FOMMEDRAFT_149650 [Fomitiporia mediterranea MF3/22]EJC97577.1 hypothetical protein FOMMEDRAFT_149650 [Fomitiporia mediterranea MF3/22]